ncbi:MAG: prolipoprotein diacylglyceryl transferase [Rhizobiaceae bacterium]|nr:prolipoprotein diacylglyceryl transferase [Rhizobiaceae bacterium]
MLPYIHIEPIRVGGLTIGIFGLLVAIGCLSGYLVARREARLRGLDPAVIDGCLFWALIPGFFMSRLVELVFYHPEELIAQPWALLNLWASMSSFGGFLGGTLGVVGYFLYSRKPVIAYCECLVVGFVIGWFFGRLGCSIVHDHPGALTDFPLGVRFPDGTRHDLGLYEWLFTIIVIIVVFTIPRLRLPSGVLLGGVAAVYAMVRFPLDYLRVADVRYGSLTAAQYACMALFLVGVALIVHGLRRGVPAAVAR